MDMWVISDRGKAEAAGCDMEADQIIYVLTVSDVAQLYDEMREDGEAIWPKPGKDAPDWADLPAGLREKLVQNAQKYLEYGMGGGDWADPIREGILAALKGEADHEPG